MSKKKRSTESELVDVMSEDFKRTVSECGRFSRCMKWTWDGCAYRRIVMCHGLRHHATIYMWGQFSTSINGRLIQTGSFPIGQMKEAMAELDEVFTTQVLRLWKRP